MGEARKGGEARRDARMIEAEGAERGDGGGGVLAVMRAAQRGDAGKIGDERRAPARAAPEAPLFENDAGIERRAGGGDLRQIAPGGAKLIGDGAGVIVIDADDGEIGGMDEAGLDRRVILHGSVAVEMIGRDVEENADGRVERGREVDLVRRAFDDMDAGFFGRRQSARIGVPILPPTCDVESEAREKMRDEGGGGGFAVGAGDGDEGRFRREAAALAAEKLDVADDLDARLARLEDGPVRGGMGQRHAGRKDEGRERRASRRSPDFRS